MFHDVLVSSNYEKVFQTFLLVYVNWDCVVAVWSSSEKASLKKKEEFEDLS